MVLKLLYIIFGIVYCDCYRIQKCCEYNQKLATNFSSCISFDGEGGAAGQLMSMSVGNVTKLLLGHLHTCSKGEGIAVSFNNEAFLLDSGALLVTGVFDNLKPKTMVFPYESFCLDQVSLSDHSEQNYEKFKMVRGVPTCKNGYYYNNDSSIVDLGAEFNILTNGNITVIDVGSNEYCVHYSNIGGKFDTNLQYCTLTTEKRKSDKISFQGMLYIAYFIVGSFFLAATLMMYALVVELRETMYASLLMNHVACLFVCYAMMAAERILLPPLCTWRCILIGHTIQFSFIAAIFWLNTMCVYISRNFRSIKTLKSPRPKNKFQYVKYSAYVWGSAFSITLATFLVDYNMLFSEKMRPRFGFKVCWFAGYWAKFWYFYLPISILLFANLILFAFTVKKILTMQNESKRILSRESKKHVGNRMVAQQSNKLMRYTKLFALMGITWIFEVLSWAVEGPDWFWYLTDAINALRGVFIFVVCCCKKKFFQQLFHQLRKKSKSGASHSGRNASVRDHSSDAATGNGCSSYQMVLLQNCTKLRDPEAIDSN